MKGKAHIFCGQTIALDKNATRTIRVYDCFSTIDSKGQTREYRYFGLQRDDEDESSLYLYDRSDTVFRNVDLKWLDHQKIITIWRDDNDEAAEDRQPD